MFICPEKVFDQVTRHLNSTDSNQGLVDEYKRALYDMVAQHLAGEWKSNYYFKDGMRPYFTPGSTKFINASDFLGSEAVKNNCTLDNETLVLCGLEWSRAIFEVTLATAIAFPGGAPKSKDGQVFPFAYEHVYVQRKLSLQTQQPFCSTKQALEESLD